MSEPVPPHESDITIRQVVLSWDTFIMLLLFMGGLAVFAPLLTKAAATLPVDVVDAVTRTGFFIVGMLLGIVMSIIIRTTKLRIRQTR